MTLSRARIIKAADVPPDSGPTRIEVDGPVHSALLAPVARRIPAIVVEAREEAARLVAEARTQAAAIVAEARAAAANVAETAAREAETRTIAKITADHLALRIGEEQRAERDLDRTLEIAALLAERIVGEALTLDPARIGKLAETALVETRGARQMRVECAVEDLAALRHLLGGLGDAIASIEPNHDLARGSLVVHTELGRVDARLGPQLARLAEPLREALRGQR